MIRNVAYSRRILPLITSQFFGVFNDHAFKMFVVLSVFKGQPNYFEGAAFMFLLTAAYVLPFILFSGITGAAADRLPKRSILIIAKFAELIVMILGTVCFLRVESWGMYPLLGVMFLMTTQSAFFSPAYNGLIPETFPEYEISKANGLNGMLTFIAAILGAGIAPLFWEFCNKSFLQCGEMLCLFSVFGFIAAVLVLPTIGGNRKDSGSAFRSFVEGWKAMVETRALWVTAVGDAFFCSIGVVIQTLIVLYANYVLKAGELELSAMMLAPALGMGLGCYFCGILSGRKVELGFVLPAGFLLGLFLILAGFNPGGPVQLTAKVTVHPCILIWLLLAGISGGFFVVPLRAYFQQWVNPAKRGVALAASNLLSFASMLIFSFLLLLLVAGAAPENTTVLPSWLMRFELPAFNPGSLFCFAGCVSIVGAFAGIFLLPDLPFRFIVLLLMNTLMKLRVIGSEKIPEHGAALLVSNHASFVDGLLISACTSRRIRFLMHEDYYRLPLLHPLARFFGFIEVPRNSRIKSMRNMITEVQDALRNGDVVCVFPEGKITRNGLMDEFSSGYTVMLPQDCKVPVIPVRIGMVWGSIFSYYYGKLKFRMPKEIPHPVSVTFGNPIPEGTTSFELRQIISELGAETEMVPRASERPLHYQVAKNAKRHPFRKLICESGGKELNCFQFCVGSAVLSRKIRDLVAPECKYVGVMLPNCAASAVACTAVMMADKVPAILNFTATRDSLIYAVKKAGATHILTSRKFLSKIGFEPMPEMVFLEDMAKTVTRWDKISMALMAVLLPHQEFMNLLSPLTHRDVMNTAAVLFSSGSTGIPKGVMLSHHNFNSDVYACTKVVAWDNNDVIVGNLPMFHAFGLISAYWLPLMIACKVVYVTSPLDCGAVTKACLDHKVTILLGTPTFIQSYLRRCDQQIFTNLRLAIAGAERLRSDISTKFEQIVNGERTLIEGYGCTELSPIVAINVGNSILNMGKTVGKAGSIGPAMPGICAKIVDPVTRKQLPPDTEGLLVIKGPTVMQGYLDEPRLTEEAVQDGWYNTGDIGKIDADGYITLCGRLSRFSKIGGEMVPHELVECAINEILHVEEKVAAVTGIPDASKGEALVVFYTNLPIPPEKVIEEMRARNITNLWIPKAGNFHQVDSLPMLGSGKLDLVALKKYAEDLAAGKVLKTK
ncbi:MAG: MFS transporter [Lentisphaeria bacterium]|nr:MFS transporter [Lentisphaeria bacterium]